jgi:hypothetical protein
MLSNVQEAKPSDESSSLVMQTNDDFCFSAAMLFSHEFVSNHFAQIPNSNSPISRVISHEKLFIQIQKNKEI